jgi:hypothetical protein
MSSFRSRFNKPQSAVMHSSAIAGVADNGTPSFGAVSPQSFEQRQAIERNRQHVKSFRDATIHSNYRQHALTVDNRQAGASQPSSKELSPSDTKQRFEATARPQALTLPNRQTGAAQRTALSASSVQSPRIPQAGYREPNRRGYNPYQ